MSTTIFMADNVTYRAALVQFQRRWLTARLREHGWNREAAADAIGVSRPTIYRLITRLGVAAPKACLRHCSVCGLQGHNIQSCVHRRRVLV